MGTLVQAVTFMLIVSAVSHPEAANCGAYGSQTCDMLRNVFTQVFVASFTREGFNFNQIDYWCSYVTMARDCLQYLDDCVPERVPDIHDFFYGTASLLTVCNTATPTLLSQGNQVVRCTNSAGSTPMFGNCVRNFQGAIAEFSRQLNGGAIFENGVKLSTICCGLEKYNQCFPDEAALGICGQSAFELGRAVGRSLSEAYGCSQRRC